MSGSRSSVADRAAQVRFRRALSLMAMTLVVPGSAQLAAGDRRVGAVAFRIWLTLLAGTLALGLAVLVHPTLVFWLVSTTWLLLVVRLALFAAAIGWAWLIVDAWRIGQPLSLGLAHRRTVVGVNGVLCLSVAGSLLFGAHVVGVQRGFIQTMFSGTEVVGAHDGRFNVLLLGGDSGASRWGMRPDSMTIASIDAATGKTVLIGLPRNLEKVPFPAGTPMHREFPDGFDCDGCYLNGISTWAEDHTELFGRSRTPGIDATIMGIEGVTGLRINYWAMVNLEGFKDLVDAVGGVELTVREPIPVGGLGDDVTGYLDPGTRRLNGFETLWYARAREGSDDYSRMARQKCVMNAMLQQISPQTAVTKFEDIAKASTEMVSTNLPASELDTFMALALRARSQPVATLSLVPPMISTSDPDFDLVREKVATAIARSEGDATPGSEHHRKKPKQSTEMTGGSLGSLSDGYAANEADDLASAC